MGNLNTTQLHLNNIPKKASFPLLYLISHKPPKHMVNKNVGKSMFIKLKNHPWPSQTKTPNSFAYESTTLPSKQRSEWGRKPDTIERIKSKLQILISKSWERSTKRQAKQHLINRSCCWFGSKNENVNEEKEFFLSTFNRWTERVKKGCVVDCGFLFSMISVGSVCRQT